MMAFKIKAYRTYPEYHLQTSVCDWLSRDGRVPFFHPPNRPKSPAEWIKQKAMGAKAGVADLVFPAPASLFLELKAAGGKQEPSQLEFQRYCKEYGLEYHLAYSFEEAQEIIQTYATWGFST